MKWHDRRLLDLFDIEHPIIQAPMAGPVSPQMAMRVSAVVAAGHTEIPRAWLTRRAQGP